MKTCSYTCPLQITLATPALRAFHFQENDSSTLDATHYWQLGNKAITLFVFISCVITLFIQTLALGYSTCKCSLLIYEAVNFQEWLDVRSVFAGPVLSPTAAMWGTKIQLKPLSFNCLGTEIFIYLFYFLLCVSH